MKRLQQWTIAILLIVASGVLSCKKELSCENCLPAGASAAPANQPPIARAGADQTTVLPRDSVLLDGSASTDADGRITAYQWTRISGPASLIIDHPAAAATNVADLTQGLYQFELTVTDNGGLSAKDTVVVSVNATVVPGCAVDIRPQIVASLVAMGRLSQSKELITTVSAGNKIFFAGGRLAPGSNGASSRVDIYDLDTRSWSTAELSKPRYGIAAVAAGRKVFFAVGTVRDISLSSVFATVDIYDLATNTWSVASLSRPRSHIAAATVGNKVFFAGGIDNWTGPPITPTATVDIYDLSTNTWSVTKLSEARGNVSAVTFQDKIYFAGGHLEDWYFDVSDRIDIYNQTTNSWSVASLLQPMGYLAGIAVGDSIYWASFCFVEIKNALTGSSSAAHLSQPRYWNNTFGQNAVVKDRKIIFCNHEVLSEASKFDIYDTSTSTWSVGFLPFSIYNASIISVNNTVYIAGAMENGFLSNKVWKLEF